VRVALLGTGVEAIPPTGYGGVERTIAELSAALTAAGASVSVLNEVHRHRSTDEFRFARHLGRTVPLEGFDILHASTPIVANRLAQLRRAFVYTSHSRHWFEASGLRGRWGRWVEVRAVRRATRTIALTARLQDRMRTLAGADAAARTSVIPIGVDTARFQPDEGHRTGTVALGVGIVRPFKRWEVAAKALRGTGLHLRLIGPTPEPEYARRVAAAGEGVDVVGPVDDEALRSEYARADVLVHPSRVELLAGVVLQGMSAGLPVVGAAPVADLVGPGCGACAPGGSDEDAVAAFLHDRLAEYGSDADRRRADGLRARAWAQSRYDWSTVARAHLALYERVVAATR
jgi:glycosyltransferase involved in cell wall biosynthesis